MGTKTTFFKDSVFTSLREQDCIWLHTLHSNASTASKFNQSLTINIVLEVNANQQCLCQWRTVSGLHLIDGER